MWKCKQPFQTVPAEKGDIFQEHHKENQLYHILIKVFFRQISILDDFLIYRTIFSFQHTKHKQIPQMCYMYFFMNPYWEYYQYNINLLSQLVRYPLTLWQTLLRSVGCFCHSDVGVDKLCNFHTHNMVEGCFSLLFVTFYILIYHLL